MSTRCRITRVARSVARSSCGRTTRTTRAISGSNREGPRSGAGSLPLRTQRSVSDALWRPQRAEQGLQQGMLQGGRRVRMSATELACVDLRKHQPAQSGRVDIVADGPLVLPPTEELNHSLYRPRVCPPPSIANRRLRVIRGLSEHRAEGTLPM